MRKGKYLFTSESVGEGHPDKICDQISDAFLDEAIRQDPNSRVAIETLTTTGLIVVAGEVTTKGHVDVQKVARDVVKRIGYNKPEYGFNADDVAVMVSIHEQSPDISQGVTSGQGLFKEQGAGDQGLMFGYATNETPELMPTTLIMAHKLVAKIADLRRKKVLKYLRPDCKSQVTIEYQDNKPLRVDTVVIAVQHDPDVQHKTIYNDMLKHVIKPVCGKLMNAKTKIYVNATGKFVIGGPPGDTGVTGRKIIVDTYGGYGCHGGGAFSGKDPSKVDRSAAYMARHVAKNIVAAGLADQCEVQLAYAIGVAEPVSILVNTFDTGNIPDEKISELVKKHFNMRPAAIIQYLDLKRPIYQKTAAYGHFGRNDPDFTWEKTNKAAELKRDAGL